MRKIIFSIIIFFLSGICVFSQVRIEGTITGETDSVPSALPFANILVLNVNDTTKMEYATITDLNGFYYIDEIAENQYIIQVSTIGYKTISEKTEFYIPVVGDALVYDYELEIDDNLLSEVVVRGQTVRQGIDKRIYTITNSDLKTARFSMDLLEKVSELSIDPVTQKIKSARGSLKILIDGVSSGEIDLKAIPADKVLKMEFYDIPPARYLGYASVVNIITKPIENGFSAGTTLQHAFTTGFANDDIFIKYIHGRNQISVDYTLNYRNYTRVDDTEGMKYTFNNVLEDRTEQAKSAFGYSDNYINLKYLNQLKDDYVFQFRFSPNYMSQHTKSDIGNIKLVNNENSYEMFGNKNNKSTVFRPSADVYFWKKLPDNQEITVDILGTTTDAKQNYAKREYLNDGTLALEDLMQQENSKKSITGAANYEKTINDHSITAGYKMDAYNMFSKVENSFDNVNYESSYLSHYIYGMFGGKVFNKMMYRLSLGAVNRDNKTFSQTRSSWIFMPVFLLAYSANSKNSFRFVYGQISTEPDLSQLSNNVIYVTNNIVSRGNPDLVNSVANMYYLTYNYLGDIFQFNADFAYVHYNKPISSYYTAEPDKIVYTSFNDKDLHSYGIQYSGSIKPFSNDILTIKLNGSVLKTISNTTHYGKVSDIYVPLWYNILIKYDNFVIDYQGNILSKQRNGLAYASDENNSHLSARWKKNNFSLSANVFWLLSISKYHSESMSQNIVQFYKDRKIHDNANMFTLGVSYTFNSGKRYEEQAKKIENKDSDAGLFK